jgi:hypothetical protein
VKFWDTSAIVPLCVEEPTTATLRRLADGDSGLVVWWSTRTECISALARRGRERHIKAATEARARRVLRELVAVWSEVLPSEVVRQRTERLLAVHALRSADAFQLAAALLWSQGRTSAHGFVCLDDRLRGAATREGFDVLPA